MARQVKRTSGVFNPDGWYGYVVYDIDDIVQLDYESNMVKLGLKELQVVKFILGAVVIFYHCFLILKYNIIWYEWMIWTMLCMGAIVFTRALGMTEGIVETIKREQYYEKLKRMLFDDDERNTPDRMMK